MFFSIIKAKLQDHLLKWGILFCIVSAFIFTIPFLFNGGDGYFAFFLIHFMIAIAYAFSIWWNAKQKMPEHKRHYTILMLILFLISAYALNREMVVFAASPAWLSALLFLLCTNYIVSIWFDLLPDWVRLCIFFIMGVGLVLFVYLSFYLLPLYLLSAFALIALGISIHTFVPILLVFYTVFLADQLADARRRYWNSLYCGLTAAITIVVFYCIAWQGHVKSMNQSHAIAVSDGTDALPVWIQVAQKIGHNAISEKVLKTNLVYVLPEWKGSFFWNLPERSFGEEQQVHDPLVVLATLFGGRVLLNEEEKIAILKSQFNSRHQAEEKLWSGKDLRTQQVVSTVRVWPESHLSYTEKVITVLNHSRQEWGADQEALYTFQLPEGGVVTALSLWINGIEEKGILTTKAKADSAYRTIVGVEVRDPSVVHWQEGNRVTVRVFPVQANENRIFKIGVTAPLRSKSGKLVYDNISFSGPNASAAHEEVRVHINKPERSAVRQASLNSRNDLAYQRSGRYRANWTIDVSDEGLTPQTFAFGGYQYAIKPYRPARTAADIRNVYLDINNSWTKDEYNAVWNSVKGKNVWVYTTEMVRLNEENRKALFDALALRQFTLFPVQIIPDLAQALLVSKSGAPTPNLSDMEGTGFFKALKEQAVNNQKLRLFNIGTGLTPYLASLKEYRFFLYEQGSVKDLQQLIASHLFVAEAESSDEVVLHSAGISIYRQRGEGASTAPDHLMRLFTYNHIMQQLGQKGMKDLYSDSTLIQKAEMAYVVSPVSSLVVLETKDDYERFGIEESEQSLKNASMKSKGAVPEPHEWVLIVIGAAIACYLMIKRGF